ncbi:MAG TPA: hypothetical protein PLR25_21820 [Planctomycetaceae bacterium]|nr:hypothetical protein [Planctomycetaceae bacterium]
MSYTGPFALVYRYKWDSNGIGTTDLGFICDPNGVVQQIVVISADGIFQKPFLFADATIQAVGQVVIEILKDNASSGEIAEVRRFVAAAESQGLLTFSLGLQQALEKYASRDSACIPQVR